MTTKAYRHGEIALVSGAVLPKGLAKSKTKVFMHGSHGHDHNIDKGDLYLYNVNDFVFGYLVAKNTKLIHPEHSPKGVAISDGVYELRKQVEHTPEGFRPVVD